MRKLNTCNPIRSCMLCACCVHVHVHVHVHVRVCVQCVCMSVCVCMCTPLYFESSASAWKHRDIGPSYEWGRSVTLVRAINRSQPGSSINSVCRIPHTHTHTHTHTQTRAHNCVYTNVYISLTIINITDTHRQSSLKRHFENIVNRKQIHKK